MSPPIFLTRSTDVAQLEDDALDKTARFRKLRVVVQGLKNLQADVILQECTPVLSHVKNTGDLLKAASTVTDSLLCTGCFDSVRVSLDHSANNEIIFCIDATEKSKRLQLGTALTQEGQGALEGSVFLPALAGRLFTASLDGTGTLNGNYQASAKLSGLYSFNVGKEAFTVNASLSKKQVDFSDTSGHCEDSVVAQVACDSLKNSFSIEIANRETLPVPGAPLSVLLSPLRSWYLAGVWNTQALTIPIAPGLTAVYCHRIRASLGVPSILLRTEHCGDLTKEFGERFGITCRLAGGTIFGASGYTIPMQDRFFLGGSFGGGKLVAGLNHRRVGPATTTMGKGGPKTFWTGGQSFAHAQVEAAMALANKELNTPLSSVPRLVLFANMAHLWNDSLRNATLKKLITSPSVFAGVACIVPTGFEGQPELQVTLGKHLQLSGTDGSAPLQIGLRVSKCWL